MARRQRPSEKPLHWVGSSKADFLDLPGAVKSDMGYALGVAQLGGKHPRAKPWKGEGPGVFEVVENYDGDAYRAIYTVRFEDVILCAPCLSEEVAVRHSHGAGGRRSGP